MGMEGSENNNNEFFHQFLSSFSKIPPEGRDTGNNFFVPQFLGGSVTFPGTRNVG